MNNKLLVATKACMAAAFLACSVAPAQQGVAQSLNAINQLNLSGSATFGLATGEAFNVSAQEIQGGGSDGSITPFAVTSGSSFGLGGSASSAVVGNAGQSSLVVTLDRNGFLPVDETDGSTTSNIVGNGSVTAVAGITPFGGDALSGGLALTNVPSRVILNQDSSDGVPSIKIVSFASATDVDDNAIPGVTSDINGAAINQTLLGASQVNAGVVVTNQVINSLTVFE